MIIRYSDGSSVECAMHRLEGGIVRAEIAGIEDAVAYTLIQGKWISETGLAVTFEFPLDTGRDRSRSMPLNVCEQESRCATGGDCLFRPASGACAGLVN
jgi:hypothetical protein